MTRADLRAARLLRCAALGLALFAPLSRAAPAAAAPVAASDYDAFWLWAGVAGRTDLDRARHLYLLQGEVDPPDARHGEATLHAMGGAAPGAHRAPLHLVYRVRSLDWPQRIFDQIRGRLSLWRREPGVVEGIQLDFDAGTRTLGGYAAFLRQVRRELPPGTHLSITGLMDWASQARPEDLSALSDVVDEIVFQTYRGRSTVPDVDAYLSRLGRLTIPFKLGLAEGAEWTSPAALAVNPNFRGYVVFLRN